MPVYAITFRLSKDDYEGVTYNDRYDSLVDAIESLSPKADCYWTDSTSFFLFRLPRPPRFVKNYIEANAKLDPDGDLVFGFAVRSGSSFVIGQPDDESTLENLRNEMRGATEIV